MWPAITALSVEKPKKGRPARVAENDWFINSYRQIDHSDLRIELTAYDSIEANSRMSYIPIDVKPVPIELVDESTPSSVRLTFDHTEAFTHRADGEDASKRYGQIRVSGRATFGSPDQLLEDWVATWRYPITKTPSVLDKAPFVRPTPNLTFDILDDTGFLLEQIRGDVSIAITVGADGRAPSRSPRWLVDLQFDPDDYSAPPSRIIARIEDA